MSTANDLIQVDAHIFKIEKIEANKKIVIVQVRDKKWNYTVHSTNTEIIECLTNYANKNSIARFYVLKKSPINIIKCE